LSGISVWANGIYEMKAVALAQSTQISATLSEACSCTVPARRVSVAQQLLLDQPRHESLRQIPRILRRAAATPQVGGKHMVFVCTTGRRESTAPP
jgi:hypothetical protein